MKVYPDAADAADESDRSTGDESASWRERTVNFLERHTGPPLRAVLETLRRSTPAGVLFQEPFGALAPRRPFTASRTIRKIRCIRSIRINLRRWGMPEVVPPGAKSNAYTPRTPRAWPPRGHRPTIENQPSRARVYTACLFCNTDLGANHFLSTFPVGRRLAFDPRKGRLWVICTRCGRWNLTPLDERWEAIDDAERLFRGTRLRMSTDNIGLACLRGSFELVRIGPALLPEIASWRYGARLARLEPDEPHPRGLFVRGAHLIARATAAALVGYAHAVGRALLSSRRGGAGTPREGFALAAQASPRHRVRYSHRRHGASRRWKDARDAQRRRGEPGRGAARDREARRRRRSRRLLHACRVTRHAHIVGPLSRRAERGAASA